MPSATSRTKSAEKISREFAQRLQRLGPTQSVHALVMIDAEAASGPAEDASVRSARPRLKGAERGRRASQVRETAAGALPEVDRILERYHGRRLAGAVNPLGFVPVVTTPAGLRALAASDRVKAILEDQKISALKK
jgi:hypothetical protein